MEVINSDISCNHTRRWGGRVEEGREGGRRKEGREGGKGGKLSTGNGGTESSLQPTEPRQISWL